VLAGLVANMPSADVAAASNLSVQAFVKQQLDPIATKQPAVQHAVDGTIRALFGFIPADQGLIRIAFRCSAHLKHSRLHNIHE
jgi:hypothetical protein